MTDFDHGHREEEPPAPPPLRRTLREALLAASPVILGYLTMGMAFGVLLVTSVPEANGWWCLGFSACALSGSMQFASVEMLANAASYSLLVTAALALLINIRYCVYGLPFLNLFRQYPWPLRLFLIQNLSDETYAIMASSKRTGREQRTFITTVAALDYTSWVAGTVLGALVGRHLPFPTEGIDFAMVALFVVILVDLCREKANRMPAAVGALSTLVVILPAMLLYPHLANKTLLAAMALMATILLLQRPRQAPKETPQP
ncbi:MAG: AzlC family ABC transporter permease [Oligosphaeraceae bacterium]